MESLNNTIEEISKKFLDEAQKSPALVEDMAAMEQYMAESYSGRIFVELIQNADDCNSTSICLVQKGEDLYFANNGKAFDSEDIITISRSGSSMKKRGESIGYRGVGFKSTTALSSDIYIYSNNSVFSFSKKIAAEKLGVDKRRVPTVRIPFLVETLNIENENEIKRLITQGYTTVFIFKNANIQKIEDEIREFTSDSFIFLKHIQSCFINLNNDTKNYRMRRIIDNDGEVLSIDETAWKIYRSGTTALAFKEENGKVVQCSEKEAVYHCFLPTLDAVPFGFKINADFSTDPSRKHIVNDDITERALEDVAIWIRDLAEEILIGRKSDSKLLSLLRGQRNFTATNQRLTGKLKDRIGKMVVHTNDGNALYVSEYKNLPEWLDSQEKVILRRYSQTIRNSSLPTEVYNNNYQVEEFLKDFSTREFSNEELIHILEEKDTLEKLSKETVTKLTERIIKKASLNQQIYGETVNIAKAINTIADQKEGNQIIESLTEELSEKELQFVNENAKIALRKKNYLSQENNSEPKEFVKKIMPRVMQSSKPKVAKWRSAEQRVAQIERFMGNSVQDVSRMNVGYDVESTTPEGKKRYIEVKSLSGENAEFAITNNEYTAAHQYGEDYYICLILEEKAIYISNPLEKLSFTKRIRQWEWVCDQYSGIEIPFDIE